MVDFALASGANAFGFPPRVVNRAADEQDYEQNGITDFPDSKAYWYTDGGTLDNEPIGRTLDITGDLDADDLLRRLLVLIHPDPPTRYRPGPAWTDPDDPRRGSRRSPAPSPCRPRRASTTTSGTRPRPTGGWSRRTSSRVLLATTLAKLDPTEQAALLSELAHLEDPDDQQAEGAASLTEDVVRDTFDHAAGLTGKHMIGIEVLSPLLLPEARVKRRSGQRPAGREFHRFG